ncbi:MAG: hypothetical protein Q7R57_01515, partial [Dehalococcoidales bacterium]|nr:hypothetical protein [Dehalococcoidales bacterium]
MRITRETLIRIAKETAQKRALADPGLVAAYLTGSLRSDNPFLGNSTDIDIVLVHAGQPKVRREILPVTPEIHLDIVHNPRSEYKKPKELRIHPWLGPELYDPLPLYVTQHFFEFVQAGVRAGYDEPVNVLARARRNAEHARQIWSGLQLSQETGPARLLSYLKSLNHAANAVALLTGGPLAERRFLLQFQERAGAAGAPGLAAGLLGLLGGAQVDAATLSKFLTEWEKTFVEAASRNKVHAKSPVQETGLPRGNRDYPASIAAPRVAYYKLAFEAMLAGESPQSVLWPLVHTWTLSAAVLPPTHQSKWQAACETLGLTGEAFNERMEGLDRFLDT